MIPSAIGSDAERAIKSVQDALPATKRVVCGVDVVEIDQFKRDMKVGGRRFLERLFVQSELQLTAEKPHRLAARFAAKEATLKALGTGLRGLSWHEIEIRAEPTGQPYISLAGRARQTALDRGVVHLSLSLTHSNQIAIALVVGLLSDES